MISPTTLTFSVLALVLGERPLRTGSGSTSARSARRSGRRRGGVRDRRRRGVRTPDSPKTWVAVVDVVVAVRSSCSVVRACAAAEPGADGGEVDQMSKVASSPVIAVVGAGAALANPGGFIPIALKTISEPDPSAAQYIVEWLFFALVSLLPLAVALVLLVVAPDWAKRCSAARGAGSSGTPGGGLIVVLLVLAAAAPERHRGPDRLESERDLFRALETPLHSEHARVRSRADTRAPRRGREASSWARCPARARPAASGPSPRAARAAAVPRRASHRETPAASGGGRPAPHRREERRGSASPTRCAGRAGHPEHEQEKGKREPAPDDARPCVEHQRGRQANRRRRLAGARRATPSKPTTP